MFATVSHRDAVALFFKTGPTPALPWGGGKSKAS